MIELSLQQKESFVVATPCFHTCSRKTTAISENEGLHRTFLIHLLESTIHDILDKRCLPWQVEESNSTFSMHFEHLKTNDGTYLSDGALAQHRCISSPKNGGHSLGTSGL